MWRKISRGPLPLVAVMALTLEWACSAPASGAEAQPGAPRPAAAEEASSGKGDIELETKIVQATVYSGEAQIVRRGVVDLKAGFSRLVCGDLPARFVETSLNVGGSGTSRVKILGIDLERLEKREVDSEKYKELKTRLESLDGEYSDLSIRMAALETRREMMSAIYKFSRDDAKDELARESFSVEDWKGLLEFLEIEDGGTGRMLKRFRQRSAELSVQMDWVRAELAAMQTGETDSRSVVISCESESAGEFTVDIEYVVPGAGWTPEYTLRLIDDEKKVDISYNARISQSTGEDWEGVTVFLSTSRPSVGAAPPFLSPYFIGWTGGRISGRVISASTREPIAYANVVVFGTKIGAMTLQDGTFSISGVKEGAYTVRAMMMGYMPQHKRVAIVPGSDSYIDFELVEQVVGAAGKDILEELPVDEVVEAIRLKGGDVKSGEDLHVRGGRVGEIPPPMVPAERVQADIAQTEFGATLKVARSVDLGSGAEPKRSLILGERFDGNFSLYTVPRLSASVFVEGFISNGLDIPLLEGTAEVYVETATAGSQARVSNFVGKEKVGPVAPGQEFKLHFGVEQDIKVGHKLEKKEYLTKEGKARSKIRYSYLVTLENFSERAVEIAVADRIPVSFRKEVEIDDVDLSPEPVERGEDGILTWKLRIEPGARAEIRIGYTIVYPGDWPESELNLGQ